MDSREITDFQSDYKNDDIEIIEFIGANRIFLLIKTKLNEKLTKFMHETCVFPNPK